MHTTGLLTCQEIEVKHNEKINQHTPLKSKQIKIKYIKTFHRENFKKDP